MRSRPPATAVLPCGPAGDTAERLYGLRHDGMWFHVTDAVSAAAAADWLTRGGPRVSLF